MRISDENKTKLKAIKKAFELHSLEEAMELTLKSTGMSFMARLKMSPRLWEIPYKLLPDVEFSEIVSDVFPNEGVVYIITDIYSLSEIENKEYFDDRIRKVTFDMIRSLITKVIEEGKHDLLRYGFYLAKTWYTTGGWTEKGTEERVIHQLELEGRRHLIAWAIPNMGV